MLVPKAVIDAIRQNPEMDEPRLHYAKQLRANDEEAKAELIETQCALARRQQRDGTWGELKRREQHLLERYKSQWCEEVDIDPASVEYTRGLIGIWKCTIQELVEKVATVLLNNPVMSLELRLSQSTPTKLIHGQGLELVRDLKLVFSETHVLSQDGIHRWYSTLFSQPLWQSLERLELWGVQLPEVDIARLLSSPDARRIRKLFLAYNKLGDRGCDHLMRALPHSELRELGIAHNGLTNDGAKAIAECPKLANLVKLVLSANDIGDAGVRAISRGRYLRSLERLFLDQNAFSDDGLIALATTKLRTLQFVDVDLNDFEQMGVGPLLDWESHDPSRRVVLMRRGAHDDRIFDY